MVISAPVARAVMQVCVAGLLYPWGAALHKSSCHGGLALSARDTWGLWCCSSMTAGFRETVHLLKIYFSYILNALAVEIRIIKGIALFLTLGRTNFSLVCPLSDQFQMSWQGGGRAVLKISLNPRRAGGLCFPCCAGGGAFSRRPLTRLLGHVATRGKRQSKERQK